MSTVNELLNNSAFADDYSEHIVVSTDRFITVPASLRRIAVAGDCDVETVTFDCPRFWDGGRIDLSTMTIYINYQRSDGGKSKYHAYDAVVDEKDQTLMHFTWTISAFAAEVKGPLNFLICAKYIDENGEELFHWNSELNSEMTISAGLEVYDTVMSKHADVITQMLNRIAELEAKVLELTAAKGGDV